MLRLKEQFKVGGGEVVRQRQGKGVNDTYVC